MSIVHGKAITAEDIELEVSRFGEKEFASLCNSVIWSLVKSKCTSLPSFTERTKSKDGGIDAEMNFKEHFVENGIDSTWDNEFENIESDDVLIRNGWCVYQFKQRNVRTTKDNDLFSSLKSSLKGEIKKLYERSRKRPSLYVLFVNLDLMHETPVERATSPQIKELKDSILDEYDQKDSIPVEIIDAALLAPMLNDSPHLRSAYFATDKFYSWDLEWHSHKQSGYIGNWKVKNKNEIHHDEYVKEKVNRILFENDDTIEVEENTQLLNEIKSSLSNELIRTIILTGYEGIGKIRHAIEATKEIHFNTVFVVDALSIDISYLLSLANNSDEIVVIIENPSPDRIKDIIEKVNKLTNLKLIITTEFIEISSQLPFCKSDPSVSIHPLKRLNFEQSSRLIQNIGSQNDKNIEIEIIKKANGIPETLINASKVQFREIGNDNIIKNASERMLHYVAKRFDRDVVESLTLLSLFIYTGYKKERIDELKIILKHFRFETDLNRVLRNIEMLLKTDYLKEKGEYVSVEPEFFSIYLAKQALLARENELISLFQDLPNSGKYRLLKRLISIDSDEVNKFWEIFIKNAGLLDKFKSIADDPSLMKFVSCLKPMEIAEKLYSEISSLAAKERKELVVGNIRRQIIYLIPELLYRKQTSYKGLQILLFLAEAENETWGNNATNIFIEMFHPAHPQLPLSFNDRIRLIQEVISEGNPDKVKLIIKSIESGLSHHLGMIQIHHSAGNEPFDEPFYSIKRTYGEVNQYRISLFDFLMKLTQSEIQDVTLLVTEKVLHVLWCLGIELNVEESFKKYEEVKVKILDKELNINKIKFVKSLESYIENLERHIESASKVLKEGTYSYENEEKDIKEYIHQQEVYINKVKIELISDIESSDFEYRFKKNIGFIDWLEAEEKIKLDDGTKIRHIDLISKQLASEVILDTKLLSKELLEWLFSNEAQYALNFVWHLGCLDSDMLFEKYFISLFQDSEKCRFFEFYYAGLGSNKFDYVKTKLVHLIDETNTTPHVLFYIANTLKKEFEFSKMYNQILEGRFTANEVIQSLRFSEWFKQLKIEDKFSLFRRAHTENAENIQLIIQTISFEIKDLSSLSDSNKDFVSSILIEAKMNNNSDEYNNDIVAERLALSDIERGYTLFKKLIEQNRHDHKYNPLDKYSNKLWSILNENNHEKVYRILLDSANENSTVKFSISWHITRVLNLESDFEVLLKLVKESEQYAEIISDFVIRDHPNFWQLSKEIITLYPANERIKGYLFSGVMKMGTIISGKMSIFYDKCIEATQTQTDESYSSTPYQIWLSEVISDLTNFSESERNREIQEDINQ